MKRASMWFISLFLVVVVFLAFVCFRGLESSDKTNLETVPGEFQTALVEAEDYIAKSGVSRARLVYHLMSTGVGAEAAQYAANNVVVDYNDEAVQSAIGFIRGNPNIGEIDLSSNLEGAGFEQEQIKYAIEFVFGKGSP